MLAAARKHKRVVQVGTQRRSTPHLIEARDRIIREGKLGRIGLVEIYCYYHMRAGGNPPDTPPPDYLDYEMWTGPGAHAAVQPDGPSAGLAGVHGVRQRHRRRHVRPHVRHGPLDARTWAGRSAIASTGGILVDKGEQGQHLRHADRHLRLRRPERRLAASHLGHAARSEISLGRDLLRRQGHAEGQRVWLRLHRPRRPGQADPSRRDLRVASSIPKTRPRRTWSSTSPRPSGGTCRTSWRPSPRRGKPVADIEQGYISTASCILANLAMQARPHARPGTPRSSRWSATTRPTVSCSGPTAGRGCIRSRRKAEGVRQIRRTVGQAPDA